VNQVVTVNEHSSGGVLWRPKEGASSVEVCLIATRGKTRWQLPKGHVIAHESEAEAARREVREETGCDGEVEEDLGEIVFWFFIGKARDRRRVRKSVRFFLLRYRSGVTSDHDGEVDDASWLDAEIAVRQLTFDSERQILARALERLRRRSAPPSPVDPAA
jgi:8-oxo-dGTP pyrophosphatase MutT (NUDIX family)